MLRASELFLIAPDNVLAPSGSDSTPDQKELPHGSLFAGAWSEIEARWGQ